MIIYCCDRCHRKLRDSSNQKFEIHKAASYFKDFHFPARIDILLCSDCEEDFEAWLYPKKEDDNENDEI